MGEIRIYFIIVKISKNILYLIESIYSYLFEISQLMILPLNLGLNEGLGTFTQEE